MMEYERDRMSNQLWLRDSESPGVGDLCDPPLFHLGRPYPDDPDGGEGDVCPYLRPVELDWRQIPMATGILNMKKATSRAAQAKNETVLRTKQFQRAAILFKQVSDPTRLQVVTLLSERERHVGGLCEQLTQSQAAVSHHLGLLRHGGIIDRRRQGKNSFYRLTDVGERLSKIVKGVVV
jgi:DNA-binding transcriptional ArsR family regulator